MEGSEMDEDYELGGDLPVTKGDKWNKRYFHTILFFPHALLFPRYIKV